MSRGFRELLACLARGEHPGRNAQQRLAGILREPWGQAPALTPPELLARAEVSPAKLLPGEPLLVAVAADGRATLHALREGGPLPLGPEAQRCLRLAGQLAQELAPTLANPAPAPLPSTAHTLWWTRESPEALEGRSFGLALLLGEVSKRCAHPVPPTLVALAAVAQDGSLERVDGLAAKLAVVADAAVSVKEVLVAQEQESEARPLAEKHGLALVALPHARDAVARAFPDATRAAPPSWSDAREVDAAALRQKAHIDAPRVLSRWERVVLPLQWLVELRPADPRLAFALAIAQRHAGEPAVSIPWDEAAFAARGLEYAAHVVQSAADAGDERCAEHQARVRTLADLLPAERGALMARGAVARALAIMGRYPEALIEARRAVLGWLAREERADASYALCEWLRVASIARDEESFEEARAQRRAFPEDSPATLYLALAETAGLVRLGRPTEALEASANPGVAQGIAFESLLRWRARAAASAARIALAAELRAQLAAYGAGRMPSRFALLDAAVEARDEALCEQLCGELFSLSPQGTRWLRGAEGPLEQAKKLADEYPY